jgi:hypothetical protein
MKHCQRFHQRIVLPAILATCATLAIQASAIAAGPGDNASFFVIGKTWHFQQDASGLHGPNDVHYFAEIFSKAGGQVSDGSMRLLVPGAEPIPFDHATDNGMVLHARNGKIHLDVSDLDAELPNGDYAFSFHTPTGDVTDFAVSLGDAGSVTELPPPPAIQLVQRGGAAYPQAVRAGEDLRISWTPFASGRADPNGIIDDLIFVILEDCRGNRVYHSGRPLQTPNPLVEPDKPSATWLSYNASAITVSGDALVPGMSYRLEVELAKLMDTDQLQGVVGMSTYAVTTHLDIQTAGEVTPGACPDPGDTGTSALNPAGKPSVAG